MQEFRFLDQKRQAGALTPAEQARHAELRDLVGFEQPAPARGGFDVTAAAAQLRESLLPAGLRSRPADSHAPPPPASAPPAPPPPLAEPEPPLSADPFFDPATLGQEVRPQAWNPEAPGYDPDAPYDEAAWIAAGYDPSATYDWSAIGEAAAPAPDAVGDLVLEPEPVEELHAPPAEPPPLQFGEYDAPGVPVSPGEPVELVEAPLAAEPDGGWFDDSGAAAPATPPLKAPAFGEYDAMPLAAPVLELGETPLGWQPDGVLDAGFELASDGSFGESDGLPLLTPWSETDRAAPAERWESVPALDLSAPFEAVVIPAAAASRAPEPFASLEPEEPLEPVLEPELVPEPEPVLEPEPEFSTEPEPVHLPELGQAEEIDIPPEISAAYDLPPRATPALDFDAPPPAPFEPPTVEPGISFETAAEREPEIEPVALAPSGAALVTGTQRVVIHTLDGLVLRGTLTDADLQAPELELETGAPGAVERVSTGGVKAIFFMMAPGEQPPVAQGKRVRVTFRDGRQVAGFSPGYREDLVGFFVVLADSRTNTGRIWVYQAAVKQVSVS